MVQDLPPVIEEASKNLPPDLRERITFEAYDFFTPQTVHDADVYFFRWIFHNWPDKYCIDILKNLIPALKQGAKIVISDAVVPPAGRMSPAMESRIRSFDLVMTAIQNASEREVGEWEQLFLQADPGFEFKGATQPPGSNLSLLVAEWKGT